jgi:hypothetical protein
VSTFFSDGLMAAQSICDEAPEAALLADPRHTEFANGFLTGLADSLRSTPGLIHKMVEQAVSAAADLNVEPLQGLVEVLQNADDVSAHCVRFRPRVRCRPPRIPRLRRTPARVRRRHCPSRAVGRHRRIREQPCGHKQQQALGGQAVRGPRDPSASR